MPKSACYITLESLHYPHPHFLTPISLLFPEFSELNEDSGVEAEQEGGDHDHTSSSVDDDACTTQSQSQSVAEAFHHHLNGLQQCLCDLTIAAEHVTHRYNNALGSSSL